MYLSAVKSFDPNSDEASKIMEAASVGLSHLEIMAEDEDYMYLPLWEFSDTKETQRSRDILNAAGILELLTKESPSGTLRLENGRVVVTIHTAYWRKANAIHGWFVSQCQNNVDECQESVVHPEQLAYLIALCQTGIDMYNAGDLEAVAELLTPRSGFFFGSTDVDSWYYEDLANTVTQLTKALNTAAAIPGEITFRYQSSW